MDLVGYFGYWGIMMVVAFEYACFPMPSEILLPFIGITIAQNKCRYLAALMFSIAGGLLGSIMCYLIGCYGGNPLLRRIEIKFPKTRKTVRALDNLFNKYGKVTVFMARLLPLTRTYVSLIAGAVKLDIIAFSIYSLLGIVIWNTFLISLGYFLGDNWSSIQLFLSQYSRFVYAVVITLVLTIIYRKRMRRNIN